MAIVGMTITLYEKSITGKDEFNRDITEEVPVEINNVVVGQPSSEDILSEINLSGKRIAYRLAIPRDDDHNWENATVEFFGKKWRTIGIPTQYIDSFFDKNVMPWNKQISVEAYE